MIYLLPVFLGMVYCTLCFLCTVGFHVHQLKSEPHTESVGCQTEHTPCIVVISPDNDVSLVAT